MEDGVEGTQHYRPKVASGTFIGTEFADTTYTVDKGLPDILGHVCRYSDSARSEREAPVTADQGIWYPVTARSTLYTSEILCLPLRRGDAHSAYPTRC